MASQQQQKLLKPVVLYTVDTPNGQKVSNFTEELKLAYGSKTGFDVEYRKINMGENEQKEEWFLKINRELFLFSPTLEPQR